MSRSDRRRESSLSRMGRRTGLTAVVVLALAAVAWVLVETDGFGIGGTDARGAASDVDAPEQADRAFEDAARGAAAVGANRVAGHRNTG